MKNTGFITLVMLAVMAFNNVSAQTDSSKTTFYTPSKKVVVSEDVKEIKVRVFDKNDTTELNMVYEGIFIDGKEYEKYTVNHAVDWGLNLFNKKKKKSKYYYADAHWDAIGWGFTTVTDGVRFNDIDGITLKTECSSEFFINPIEVSLSLYKENLMVYTGFGLSWKNFHFDNDTRLVKQNGIAVVQSAPFGTTYKKSRLRVFSLNMPLALEFQQKVGHHKMYVSTGIVAGFNLFSSQKLKYKDANGKKAKQYNRGLNVSRISFEFMAQVGLDNVGVFVKYSPMELFEHGKGPNTQTASIGLQLSFY